MNRQAIIDSLRRDPAVTVLIIGAGINGIGVFRELALQGIDALLIEKTDFCAGTSAASGRVIHGGLRYLENGEFRLVKEALHERNRLLFNAPHYVKPLPATVPIYSYAGGMLYAMKQFLGLPSRPGDRGALILKIGLTMYDVFSGRRHPMPTHHFESATAARIKRPKLSPNIVGTATYYDARLTYAERLGLELVQDAEAILPRSRALNYVTTQGASGGTVTLLDEVSGQTFDVKPQIVVNASGAWIDFTNRSLKRETMFIGGTKGSHIVVDHPELWEATQGQLIHFVNADGRLTIFCPIEDKVLIGTTDIRIDDPETALCSEEEVDYMLQSVNHVFPAIKVDRSHIVFRLAGVRPLPANNAFTTGQISRDHSYPVVPLGNGIDFPIYSLVGGKWTTFRAFAEQVTDKLLQDLNRPRVTDSYNVQIGGGKGYPMSDQERRQWIANISKKTGLSAARIDDLLERYGTKAADVAAYLVAGEDQPLQHLPNYSQREIAYLAANEKVIHLDDLIMRRTLIGFLGRLTWELLNELADIVAPVLGWSAQDKQADIERTRQLMEQRHSAVLKPLSEPVSMAL
ncbi:MAG: glycerol-3-phosphate dehydrogenase/oxidase [Anaerolineae bacterium]|nr:glycerol-3-phosphate dehydrogenase/oxidase [Anaerolineae bacterium]